MKKHKIECLGCKQKCGLMETEFIELTYLHALKFNYLVRNEIGSVEVFKNKPHRETEGSYYRTWVERDYPMTKEEMKNRRKTSLGSYEFIQFENEPIIIKDILKGYKIIKE